MTASKLPLCDDGSIDYDAFAEKMGYSVGDEMLSFMRLAAAQVQERCAEWHDEQNRIARACCAEVGKRGDEARAAMNFHQKSAAAIRKMRV